MACTIKAERGYTMLEILIVLVIFSILSMVLYIPIMDLMRSVNQEATMLEMDESSNRALQEIADALRPGILPIPVSAPDHLLGEFSRNIINNPVRGFAGGNGMAWRTILQDGVDCIPFCVPVDFGGDGDFVDGDDYLELGMLLPNGITQYGAAYEMNGVHNRLNENASIHQHLARLKPSDLGLPVQGASVDTNAPRFSGTLVWPANSNQAFALLRFVPRPSPDDASQPDIIVESALDFDVNGDGDKQDSFLIGHMEVSYPVGRRVISGSSILLQINMDESWTPIFKLVRYRENESSPNVDYDENSNGQYGILVRLLTYDDYGQTNPLVFGKNLPGLVRRHETVVKLRNMAMN